MAKTFESRSYAPPDNRLERRFQKPWEGVTEDLDRIYNRGEITVGSPQLAQELFTKLLSDQSRTIIFGGQLGDEGKGRLVDNEITAMLQIPKVKTVNIIRYQGGNNAGHTVEKVLDTGEKVKLALHQVPSGVMYTEAVGIMDTGMVINVEDLQTEVGYVEAEESIGDIRGKLYLSKNAIHNTDLDRVTEYTNRIITSKASGGTSRGIGPSYAAHYDRTGSKINDFMVEEWREAYGQKYDLVQQTLTARGIDLATTVVPDFKATVETKTAQTRAVGGRKEFLDRLEATREWLDSRDMVRETVTIHEETISDMSKGVIFEGSQAVGLHPWLGTYPDVTASDTTASGVRDGTAFWMTKRRNESRSLNTTHPVSVIDECLHI
jgi:adenylosuccinate synthase